jgi:hypothetical protein
MKQSLAQNEASEGVKEKKGRRDLAQKKRFSISRLNLIMVKDDTRTCHLCITCPGTGCQFVGREAPYFIHS